MIDSLKDLEKLIKLLRKQGVYEFEHLGTKLKIGELPAESTSTSESVDDPYKNFPVGDLTPEQLIYYSSGGAPENDPFIEKTA